MSAPLIVAHKPDRDRYREWNSRVGLRRAAAIGAKALDVDVQLSRDRVFLATHWERPLLRDGFRDPQGRIGRFARVDRLWASDVERLRSEEGYRIRPVHQLFPTARRHGITLCLEVKEDPRTADAAAWAQLAADVRDKAAPVVIMSQPFRGAGVAALAAAKAAGLPTLLLTRGKVRPQWWDHLDWVKGPEKWTEPGRPARVRVARSRRL